MFFIKNIIRKAKGFIKYYFFPNSKLTRDLLYLLKKNKINEPIIFDIGAYHGNWISNYLKYFPNTFAYLFEPYEKSFNILEKRFKKKKRVNIFKKALSSAEGYVNVNINTKAYTNSLLDLDPLASESWGNDELKHQNKMQVEVITLDKFFSKISSDHKRINLIKLDVQGLESKVLQGGFKLLSEQLVDIILLEMIVAPTYNSQSKLSDLFKIFEDNKYYLYGIYDIEKGSKFGKIQQFDAIFIYKNFSI